MARRKLSRRRSIPDRQFCIYSVSPLTPAKAAAKVQLARRLRRETTMGLKWIAEQLGVGSWKYLSNLLEQKAPNPAQPELQS